MTSCHGSIEAQHAPVLGGRRAISTDGPGREAFTVAVTDPQKDAAADVHYLIDLLGGSYRADFNVGNFNGPTPISAT
jgi:hypothetical protein